MFADCLCEPRRHYITWICSFRQVFVLDSDTFCSGMTYHENKPLVRKIQARTYKPYVFHMCWTDNRENKLVYFKDVGLWYVKDPSENRECSNGAEMLKFDIMNSVLKGGGPKTDQCCMREKYWPKDIIIETKNTATTGSSSEPETMEEENDYGAALKQSPKTGTAATDPAAGEDDDDDDDAAAEEEEGEKPYMVIE